MRKAVISSVALVLAAVVLGTTVFREQVALAGDKVKTVFVTNNDPGRAAFAFFKSDSWQTGEDSHSVSFTVPTGKRLVIEAVSISGSLDTQGQKMLIAAVQAHVNGQLEDYFMTPTFTGTNTSSRDVFIASQQTTIYADGGTDVLLFGTRNSFSASGILNVSVQGHMIDCSAGPCN
jgi:hypothetical protein